MFAPNLLSDFGQWAAFVTRFHVRNGFVHGSLFVYFLNAVRRERWWDANSTNNQSTFDAVKLVRFSACRRFHADTGCRPHPSDSRTGSPHHSSPGGINSHI